MTEAPALSVVVIGRNEGERLSRCLASVQAMTAIPGAVEILYVDSASTDDSPQRAQAAGVRVLRVEPTRPAAAIGRNVGWRTARAPLILFLDGDTLLHPEFVAHSLGEFEAPRVAVVWGHRRELHPRESLYQRVLDLDWIYPPGPSAFCGGDSLMRRSALEAVDGFDDTLIAGEEPDLCRRLRALDWEILHVDRPMTGHDLAIHRFHQYWQRAVRSGHAYAELAWRTRRDSLPLWQNEARANLLRAGFFLLLGAGAMALSVTGGGLLPLVVALMVTSLLMLRSAWRSRWKGADTVTLLLYGVHSQLQHLPIALGQLQFHWHRLRGHRRKLLEYK